MRCSTHIFATLGEAMDSDKEKSVIDRLAGSVWDIEPGKTPLPTPGLVLLDEPTALMPAPELPPFELVRPRRKSRAGKHGAPPAKAGEKTKPRQRP
jgi:hypothetical protein